MIYKRYNGYELFVVSRLSRVCQQPLSIPASSIRMVNIAKFRKMMRLHNKHKIKPIVRAQCKVSTVFCLKQAALDDLWIIYENMSFDSEKKINSKGLMTKVSIHTKQFYVINV